MASNAFLPTCPIPRYFDAEARVKELQAMIDHPSTKDDQKANLRGPRGSLSVLVNITMLNDTDSTVQTVIDTDMGPLGLTASYQGYRGLASAKAASGMIQRQAITIEVQLMMQNRAICSEWFRERAVIAPATPGGNRLTGARIRNVLYFATAPGNQHLYVAEKKNGIME